jgi:uncharacterized delta-60 repeat protein
MLGEADAPVGRSGWIAAGLTALSCLLLIPAAALADPADLDRHFGSNGAVYLTEPSGDERVEWVDAVGPSRQSGEVFAIRSTLVSEYCGSEGCIHERTLVRYRGDGSLDRSFGGSGAVALPVAGVYARAGMVVDGRGRLLIGYSRSNDLVVERFTPDGRQDQAFGVGGSTIVPCRCGVAMDLALAIARDGSIVVGTAAPEWPSRSEAVLVRLLPEGHGDPNFGSSGVVTVPTTTTTYGHTFALQRDGSVVIGSCCEGKPGLYLTRVRSDGRVDRSFQAAARRSTSRLRGLRLASLAAVLARRGGSLDLVGSAGTGSYVARLKGDGGLDRGFGKKGVRRFFLPVSSAALDRRGRILGLGSRGHSDLVLFRLRANGRPDRSFEDGEGVQVSEAGGEGPFEVWVQSKDRPLVFDHGLEFCRGFCSAEPVLVRFRGGSEPARCLGRRATIVGTRRGEQLKGTHRRDVIAALGGADLVMGRGGDDLICGGRGRDRLIGGPGRDRLVGGPGRDRRRK